MKVLVSDPRQDLILQEFVDQGKWKTALDHCDKRLKKLKKGTDHRLQLNHLLIELRQQQIQGSITSDDLISIVSSRRELIDYLDVGEDFEFVEHIESSFGRVSGDLWKRASKSRPKDDDFYQAWFDVKYKNCQFREAAEACMHWRLHFPQKGSELTMKMILCYHLSSQTPILSMTDTSKEKDQRDKDGKMAVHLIRQAAKNTPAKSTKDVALQSNADLELLVEVFTRNKLEEEALAILADSDKGLRSPLGGWDLVRANIRLLTSLKHFAQLHQFTTELLSDAVEASLSGGTGTHWKYGEAGDDNIVIEAAVTAAARLDDGTAIQTLEKLLQQLAEVPSFNAALGLVKLKAYCATSDVCLEQMQSFYTKYQNKTQATVVLRHVPSKLSGPFADFVAGLDVLQSKAGDSKTLKAWTSSVISRINRLQVAYELTFGGFDSREAPQTLEPGTEVNIRALILECIWTYLAATVAEPSKAAADNSIADPALIIAARALIRLAVSGDAAALHQARLLLEFAVGISRYNYEAEVLLIRISRVQGAITTTFPYYKRLEIKNIQQINEAGFFLEGLASLHPHDVPSIKFSPITIFETALSWATKRRSTVEAQTIACVDNGDWVGACRAVAISTKWSQTPGFISAAAEAVRIHVRYGGDRLPISQQAFAEVVKAYTVPGSLTVDVHEMPSSPGAPLNHYSEKILLDRMYGRTLQGCFWSALVLKTLQAVVRDLPDEIEEDQIHAILEQEPPQGVFILAAAIAFVRIGLKHSAKKRIDDEALQEIERVFDAGIELISGHIETVDPAADSTPRLDSLPTAKGIALRHDALDTLQILHEAVGWMGRRSKMPEAFVSRAVSTVDGLKTRITKWAEDQADAIRAGSDVYTQEILSGKIGEAVGVLVGKDRVGEAIRAHCGSVAETLSGFKHQV